MPSAALQKRASWLLSLCSWGNNVVLWKIGQNIFGPCMDMQWKCVFYTLQGQKEISLSSGDNESRYCFEWVWVVSVGTKLVAIKWPVRSKTIMKKTQGVFFFFFAHLLYCLKIKPVYHYLSWLKSHCVMRHLMHWWQKWSSESVRAYPIYVHPSICLSVCLYSPVTQSPPVCSQQRWTALAVVV